MRADGFDAAVANTSLHIISTGNTIAGNHPIARNMRMQAPAVPLAPIVAETGEPQLNSPRSVARVGENVAPAAHVFRAGVLLDTLEHLVQRGVLDVRVLRR